MNKIKQLLAELCPEGVEFRELGELLNYEQPGKYIVNSTEYSGKYKTPVLTAGQTFILGHTNEKDGIYHAYPDKPVIIFDDFTTALKWVDFPFKVKSSAIKILTKAPNKNIDLKFIYYFMDTICFSPQEHARHWISKYSKFKIPIPPIAIQQKIVAILDSFLELHKNLQLELRTRRIQYNYYRNALLTFPTSPADTISPWLRKLLDNYCPDGVKFKKLRNFCDIQSGYAFKGKFLNQGNIPVVRIGDICNPIYSNKFNGIFSKEKPTDKYKAKKNDFLMALSGATLGKIGKIIDDGDLYINQRIALFRSNEHTGLLFHLLQSEAFSRYLNSIIPKSAQPNISIEQIGDFNVPILPPTFQQKIVAILDKFDTLINDLTYGLPAEIKLRRIQYEYYRNQLLNFPEKPTLNPAASPISE